MNMSEMTSCRLHAIRCHASAKGWKLRAAGERRSLRLALDVSITAVSCCALVCCDATSCAEDAWLCATNMAVEPAVIGSSRRGIICSVNCSWAAIKKP
jgi:hypothetical protein